MKPMNAQNGWRTMKNVVHQANERLQSVEDHEKGLS
jgi:hypothetical protein